MVSALMITCGLLAGCRGQSRQDAFWSVQREIAEADRITATAQLRVDRADRVEEYRLTGVGTEDGWDVTVLEPEIMSGVTAHLDGENSTLSYGNVILPTGDVTESGIAPVTVLPAVVEALQEGNLSRIWSENDNLAVQLVLDDTVDVTIWFDETNTPKAAELSENGTVKAACTMESFTSERSNTNGYGNETDLGGDSSGESGS